MSVKHIAIIIDSLSGGGAEKVMLKLASQLMSEGHKMVVLSLNSRTEYALPEGLSIQYLCSPGEKTKGWFNRKAMAKRLSQKVAEMESERGKFDFFLVNLEESYRLTSATQLGRCFYVVHNSLMATLARNKRMGPLKYRYMKKVIQCLNHQHLITVSKGIEQEIKACSWLNPASVQTIYNPFDAEEIQTLAAQPIGAQKPPRYVIHVGRFAKQKRHDVLFAALKLLPQDIKLVCLTGGEKKLRRLAQKMGVENRVVTPGFTQNPYPWIVGAELLVLSSDFEGLPTVLIEALICGTPVVSTDCPHGPKEILGQDLADCLVPCGAPDLLAKKIIQSLESPSNFVATPFLEQVKADMIAAQYASLVD